MLRREMITLIGAAAVWPLAARAQKQIASVARIGYLGSGRADVFANRVAALRVGLRNAGYVEGRNLIVEFRWAETQDQLPELAADLVRINVDVIFATSSTEVEAARQATTTIPIVFSAHADPVGIGHVESLARPGGNITGLSMLLTDLAVKELEILKEALPHVERIGVLWNPMTPSHPPAMRAVETTGKSLGLQLVTLPARAVDDLEGVFLTMTQESVGGFLALGSPLFQIQRVRLADQALKHRLPSMFGQKEIVQAGGLMSYAADLNDLTQQAGAYIGKILHGAKPADLPVEQASKYQLVINLKTAKELGVTIPPTFLARADEVIE